MIIRLALFEGKVAAERAAEFREQVQTRLTPLWLRFPGVRQVQVLFTLERDPGVTEVALALSMSFDSQEALDAALASEVRAESTVESLALIAAFDLRVVHYVFEQANA